MYNILLKITQKLKIFSEVYIIQPLGKFKKIILLHTLYLLHIIILEMSQYIEKRLHEQINYIIQS